MNHTDFPVAMSDLEMPLVVLTQLLQDSGLAAQGNLYYAKYHPTFSASGNIALFVTNTEANIAFYSIALAPQPQNTAWQEICAVPLVELELFQSVLEQIHLGEFKNVADRFSRDGILLTTKIIENNFGSFEVEALNPSFLEHRTHYEYFQALVEIGDRVFKNTEVLRILNTLKPALN
jgi:hypothetical protein